MAEKTKIKAVIFDMGGVILRTGNRSSRSQLAAHHGMTYEELDAFVFHCETARAASVGKITEDEHWEDVARRLNLSAGELPAFREAFWGGDTADRELLNFIDSLRPRYQTALLSNAWSGARKSMEEKYHTLEVFDLTIFSYEVNLAKPAAEIYELVLSRLGVQPQEAIFVDDFTENVEAANALGIHGVRFQNTRQVIDDIQRLLNA